jgi:hypothetical protein
MPRTLTGDKRKMNELENIHTPVRRRGHSLRQRGTANPGMVNAGQGLRYT